MIDLRIGRWEDALADVGEVDVARFEAKVSPEPNTGCFLWTACRNAKGYGSFKTRRGTMLAHRFAWLVRFGSLPAEGLQLCHRCDTPECVNPDHLYVGTAKNNSDDKMARGRDAKARGDRHPRRSSPQRWAHVDWHSIALKRALRRESNGRAKLTGTQVEEMRARALRGEPIRSLARSFGVHRTTARDAVRGVTWK